LYVKKVIQDAIENDDIERYHFNLFRGLLEKTSNWTCRMCIYTLISLPISRIFLFSTESLFPLFRFTVHMIIEELGHLWVSLCHLYNKPLPYKLFIRSHLTPNLNLLLQYLPNHSIKILLTLRASFSVTPRVIT